MTEIILTSSTLILFLIIIRKLLRGKINPSVQYVLWLLVAARLLIPGTLFTAPVSLLDSAEFLLTCIEDTFLPESETLHTSTPHTPTFPAAAPPDAAIDYGDTVVTGYPPQSTAPVAAERVNWAETIWKCGTLVAGIVFLLSNFSFYVNLRKKRRLISASELPSSCPVGVYQVPGLTSPCLFGLARPAIYLNEEALKSERLEHILIHEETHYRHGDHIWAALRCVCLAIHWYNPLVWWAAVLSRRDCELSCDTGAIHRLGEANRICYGETLLRMVVPGRHPADFLRTATTMSGGKKAMMERITLIAERPKMLKITLTAVVLITCGAAVFFFGGAAEHLPEEYYGEYQADLNAALDVPYNYLYVTIDETRFAVDTQATEKHYSSDIIDSPVYPEDRFNSANLPAAFFNGLGLPGNCPQLSDFKDRRQFLPQTSGNHSDGYVLYLLDGELWVGLPGQWLARLEAKAQSENSAEPEQNPAATASTEGKTPRYTETELTNALSILNRYESGDPVTDWLPTLTYFDWRAMCDTRDQWPEGSDRCMDVLVAISEYAVSEADITAAQMQHILSATEGLDGAYSEQYQFIVYELYQKAPSTFAYTVLESLESSYQAQIIDYLRYEEQYHRAPSADGAPMSREETIDLLRQNMSDAFYTHSSKFFSLTLPSEDCEIAETSTGITITLDNESWVLRLLTQPSQWLEEHPSQAMVLGTFDTNGTIQTYLLETEDPDAPLTQQIADSFQLHVTTDMISQLIHESFKDDTAHAIQYLPYLSWLNYREHYGEYADGGLLELLGTLRDTADSGSLSWAQYHDLLSVLPDKAIDGAFATMYQDTLQALHDHNPQQFASVLLSQFISPSEQENALKWLDMDLRTLETEAI